MENNFIEIVKNIAAVLGCVVTLSGILSVIFKNVRKFFQKIFSKIFNIYGEKKEIQTLKDYIDENIKSLQSSVEKLTKVIEDLSVKQDKHFEMYEDKIQNLEKLMDIDTEFVRTQCRAVIKNM